ncbi:MAG: hypothetical protein ACTSQY_08330 [Candidatus Odinarchaeia archaeon]
MTLRSKPETEKQRILRSLPGEPSLSEATSNACQPTKTTFERTIATIEPTPK